METIEENFIKQIKSVSGRQILRFLFVLLFYIVTNSHLCVNKMKVCRGTNETGRRQGAVESGGGMFIIQDTPI